MAARWSGTELIRLQNRLTLCKQAVQRCKTGWLSCFWGVPICDMNFGMRDFSKWNINDADFGVLWSWFAIEYRYATPGNHYRIQRNLTIILVSFIMLNFIMGFLFIVAFHLNMKHCEFGGSLVQLWWCQCGIHIWSSWLTYNQSPFMFTQWQYSQEHRRCKIQKANSEKCLKWKKKLKPSYVNVKQPS